VKRAYKFLLRPTVRQAAALGEMLRDHCSLYNAALEERRTAYRTRGATVRYGMQSAQLSDIRAFDPERQGRWSFSSQQATLRRLDKAFVAFFRRVKSGDKPGYPRFKGVGHFDSVTFPKDGDGCRWDSTPQDPVTRVRLQGVGHIRVHRHRPVEGRTKTITVKRQGKRWYVIISADEVPVEPLPATGAVVGIDMGIASFLTTSDGEHIENPRHRERAATRLAKAQQALSRCKHGSNRRRKIRERVAAIHGKICRQRADHAHKTALALVRGHDLIAHENLRIVSMVRAPAPKPDPGQPGAYLPNGTSAKAGLNRSISDAGWGAFLGILANKAESAGRVVIPVDPRNTSRRCPECGHTAEENRPTQETFRCVRCGHAAHADVVGALNVLRAGLALRDAAEAA
jgi:putative transposase